MAAGSLVWSNRDAAFGVLISLSGAIVGAAGHTSTGLTLLLGGLPAAAVGLLPTRHARLAVARIGLLFGGFIVLGSFLAQWWFLAIAGMFVLGLGAAELAARRRFGQVALALCVPVAGIGLSYPGVSSSWRIGLLLVGGSAIAYAISMALPEFDPPPQPAPALMSRARATEYGLRLGLAAAAAAALGFGLGVQHVGWIAGATLFVMRPVRQMLQARSVGRILSVFGGALVASITLDLAPGPVVSASLAALALVAATATHASRWYVTPAFSTYLVFWILLYDNDGPGSIEHRFWERVLETLAGVAIAYFFGVLVPSARRRLSDVTHPT